VLVLANTDIEKVLPRLEKLRADIKSSILHYKDIALPCIKLSIGIAQAPKHGSSSKDILRAADEALYSAKASGRDKIVVAQSSVT
jgi:diguanylate cyclase (GGDEF)-like protein